MVALLKQVADSAGFQRFILGVILFAAVLVGLETSPDLAARYGVVLHGLDRIVLGIFVVELVVKMGARGPRWWEFFKDPWNLFDFLIVAVCLLPLEAQFAAVFRLVRVLRVLRLVSALPRLQILVGALLKSIPSMGYVALLLLLLFYMYAVLGVSMFGRTDGENFGSIGRAMLTLFQIVTLEGWADIMRTQIEQPGVTRTWPVIYFVSFILLGTMIILNLLIGVIMSGMQEAQTEAEDADRARHQRSGGRPTVNDEIIRAERLIADLQEQLAIIRNRAKKE